MPCTTTKDSSLLGLKLLEDVKGFGYRKASMRRNSSRLQELKQPLFSVNGGEKANLEELFSNDNSHRSSTSEGVLSTEHFISATKSDALFRTASKITFVSWLLLLGLVAWAAPEDSWQRLEGTEKNAAVIAFFCLLLSFTLVVVVPLGIPVAIPFGMLNDATTDTSISRSNNSHSKQQDTKEKPMKDTSSSSTVKEGGDNAIQVAATIAATEVFQLSGILMAAMTVMLIAVLTNFLLAWFPTVVMVDPITHTRVFLFRYVEWTPLAGLMTFLAEAVDLPQQDDDQHKQQRRKHVLTAVAQSVSAGCGLVFPFCYGYVDWTCWLVVSLVSYLSIFPRVVMRKKRLEDVKLQQQAKQQEGNDSSNGVTGKELHDRLHFSYFLVLACAVIWTVLVVFFFVNAVLQLVYGRTTGTTGFDSTNTNSNNTNSDPFPGLGMVLDTFFDVLAKGMYMKLIVDMHRLVYDPAARARRQLSELCRLVSVLWDSASDVIVISVTVGGKTTAMLSPSFTQLMLPTLGRAAATSNTIKKDDARLALVIETDQEGARVLNSCFVDPDAIMTGDFTRLHRMDIATKQVARPSAHLVHQGRKLVQATSELVILGEGTNRQQQQQQTPQQALMEITLDRSDAKIHCEISASRHSGEAVIGVVRDTTDRHQRNQAERKAHEAIVRQTESQSINRFTRHEVKNGLLSSIEMVEGMKRLLLATAAAQAQTITDQTEKESHANMVKELGEQLHETLDTVLAETMARDVIYKEYLPRLEGCQITDLLKTSIDSKSENFPVTATPAIMPKLHVDPQLIRYIHRNAISNAIKYGKPDGKVQTKVIYSAHDQNLRIEVINEPGVGHSELVELREEASEGVFTQGKRLHKHLTDQDSQNGTISNGDGAWIMKKCAVALNGECKIKFDPQGTTFSVAFPVDPVSCTQQCITEQFVLPDDAWGIAVDDSKIQRKLMGRILLNSGLQEKRIIVLGNDADESTSLVSYISTIFAEAPDAKVLLLMDENLDYKDKEGKALLLSGSEIVFNALQELSPERESKVLALVRSANDSVTDIESYKRRAHGFFPKAPMQKGRIREILAPLWMMRFHDMPNDSMKNYMSEDSVASARRIRPPST